MNKRTTFRLILALGALVMMISMASCGKEPVPENPQDTIPTENPDNPGDDDPRDFYLGNYYLTIITDSLATDGEWFSNREYEQLTGEQEEPMYGKLSITKMDDPSKVHVEGIVIFDDEPEGPEEVEYYSTTATLNADGNLVLEPSILSNDFYDFHFTYGKIVRQKPLKFRSEMHIINGSTDWGYVMTNTCQPMEK